MCDLIVSTCALNTLYYLSNVSLPSIICVERAVLLSTRPIVLCACSFLLCMVSPTMSSKFTTSVLVLAAAYQRAKLFNPVFISEEQRWRTRRHNLPLVSAHASVPSFYSSRLSRYVLAIHLCFQSSNLGLLSTFLPPVRLCFFCFGSVSLSAQYTPQ